MNAEMPVLVQRMSEVMPEHDLIDAVAAVTCRSEASGRSVQIGDSFAFLVKLFRARGVADPGGMASRAVTRMRALAELLADPRMARYRGIAFTQDGLGEAALVRPCVIRAAARHPLTVDG